MIRILQVFLILLSVQAWAVVETYQFEDEVLRERYQSFVEELRCPKCQNQNLSGSDSPIAKDLRRELHRLLHDGQTDQQIVDFMVQRYGDFILYRPRFNAETAFLWMAPLLFLVVGLIAIITVFNKQRRSAAVDEENPLAVEEQQQLQKLFDAAHQNAANDSKREEKPDA